MGEAYAGVCVYAIAVGAIGFITAITLTIASLPVRYARARSAFAVCLTKIY